MSREATTTTSRPIFTDEERVRIIKAIAAAFRWKAVYTEDYKGDDDNMTVLAQLQEKLLDNE